MFNFIYKTNIYIYNQIFPTFFFFLISCMDFLSKTFKVCLYRERIGLRVVLLACDLLLTSHMN